MTIRLLEMITERVKYLLKAFVKVDHFAFTLTLTPGNEIYPKSHDSLPRTPWIVLETSRKTTPQPWVTRLVYLGSQGHNSVVVGVDEMVAPVRTSSLLLVFAHVDNA
ncbi:hypothetical protein DY000_02052793 [Brassica cretica]|uniref:Uncharacterized protein n=1 Tax=Brassica cretica TaxID=69181 RepID=A0ABQ7ABX9_BRACR|nr:hypothetical protein DY000_02052793 [Brassica cretica]